MKELTQKDMHSIKGGQGFGNKAKVVSLEDLCNSYVSKRRRFSPSTAAASTPYNQWAI